MTKIGQMRKDKPLEINAFSTSILKHASNRALEPSSGLKP